MGRLIESGIVSAYLDDNCNSKNIPLCKFKDKFPMDAPKFIWSTDSSPLYEGGCINKGWEGNWGDCWIEKDKEYSPIIHEILTTPKYLMLLIQSVIKNSINQLITFDIGHLIPMMDGSPIKDLIKIHYRHEFNQYITASQAYETLYFRSLSRVQNIIVLLSILICLLFFTIKSIRRKIRLNLRLFTFFIVLGTIINAFTCSTFSGVVNRYEGRVIWLLPFIIIAIISSFNRIKEMLR